MSQVGNTKAGNQSEHNNNTDKAQAREGGSLKATITVAMSNFLEAGCIVAAAGSLSLWVEYLHLSNASIGLLGAVSANGFGSALGALISGPLVDRYGRKLIYKYDLLIYMFGVLLVAFSMNFPMLLAGSIITGIAVGAAIPAAWTYIAEEAPTGKRAGRIGLGQLTWSFGPAMILFLSVMAAPLGVLGSRLIFIFLFVVALITWILQQQINESRIWEEEKKKDEEAGTQVSIKELFTIKANRQALILTTGIYLFWNLVAGVLGFFLPYIYTHIGNLSNATANMMSCVLWLFTCLSTYFVFMKFGDKWNRKMLFSIGAIMGIIAWIVLTFGNKSWFELIFFVVVWGTAAGIGAQAFYGLWSGELFKTQYKAKVQGLMFFTVRAFIGVFSLIFPAIMNDMGFTVAGCIMIFFLVIHLLIGIWLTPETRGKTLEQIMDERYGE